MPRRSAAAPPAGSCRRSSRLLADRLQALAGRYAQLRADRLALRAQLQQALGTHGSSGGSQVPARRLQQDGAEVYGGGAAAVAGEAAPEPEWWEEDAGSLLWPAGADQAPAEYRITLQV